MKIVSDLMTAGELKEKILKAKYRDLYVIGRLEAVVDGDCYWHIHNDEQIPFNVEVLLKVR